MNIAEIISACSKINNGQFFRMHMKTDCSKHLCAAYKKSGINIEKETIGVFRKGIKYLNIKDVQDHKEETGNFVIDPETGEKEYVVKYRSWANTLIPNLLIKHKQNNSVYMVVYTTRTMPRTQYYCNKKPISIKELKDKGYFINSYWNKDSTPVELTVPIQSIISIN